MGQCLSAAAPAMTGGTIADGTYVMTYYADYIDAAMYGVPPCEPGMPLEVGQWTVVVGGGGTVAQFAYSIGIHSARGDDPITPIADDQIGVATPTCGSAMGTYAYTATATGLLLAENAGPGMVFVYTFALQ